ncbi:MAG: trehalose-phosphatase [Candidatus Bathyarchaeota archaeon]|nr:trehalose-phosphatase [Candidatus Bathyarchaeota archaeon]
MRREIEEADVLALFLDYDGTLVPFKDRPKEAVATEDVREILRALVRDPKCTVAIISGRTVKDLEKMLSVKGLSLAGLHGLEIRFSDGRSFTWEKSKEAEAAIKEIKQKTIRELGYERGLYIEDKRLTLALHYRLLPREKVKRVTERFIEIAEDHLSKNDLEIMRGVEVLEVRPRGWHKGKALGEFFKRFLPTDRKILPLYVGDDLTDEDAFLYLKGWGITVRVLRDPNKPTAAKYRLLDTSEVLEFLSWIHGAIRANKENMR